MENKLSKMSLAQLWQLFPNRDMYTQCKTAFVKEQTKKAKDEFKDKYEKDIV